VAQNIWMSERQRMRVDVLALIGALLIGPMRKAHFADAPVSATPSPFLISSRSGIPIWIGSSL
jgi:hypothetical protein